MLRLIFGDLFGMADTAIHCRTDRFTGALLGNCHICVALGTRRACVHEPLWACSSMYRLTRFTAASHRQFGLTWQVRQSLLANPSG